MEHLAQLYPAYLTFFVGAMSPGPSNLTVMEVAMSGGRRDGLVVATGVVTGTMIWAILASTGLAALLIAHSGAMTTVTMAGGAYLLYLAFAFGRSAFRDRSPTVDGARSSVPHSFKALYVARSPDPRCQSQSHPFVGSDDVLGPSTWRAGLFAIRDSHRVRADRRADLRLLRHSFLNAALGTDLSTHATPDQLRPDAVLHRSGREHAAWRA